MTYAEQWEALAIRIRGLAKVCELQASTRREEPYGVAKMLRQHCRGVVESLAAFHDEYQLALPNDALTCLREFLSGRGAQFISTEQSGSDREMIAASSIMFLAAFETELSFLLSSQQERIRVRSERAFLHLQWSLAADADLRGRWNAAFNTTGETGCEQLGGVHLLAHGIFAFKVHTVHARTDLVFNEPIEQRSARAVEGFVLTEWKKATPSNAGEQFAALGVQLKEYSRGPLGGTELTGYRYGIVVSEQQLPPASIPEEPVIGGVRLRYTNVAINPRPPAEEARSQAAARSKGKRHSR